MRNQNKTKTNTEFGKKNVMEIHIDSIKDHIYQIVQSLPGQVDQETKERANQLIRNNIEQLDSVSKTIQTEEELKILFSYQQNYLNLIREFKEEIKFLNTTQEDLRKERSKFFSNTLEEVNESLKKSSIDEKLTQQWTQQLVDSYTDSLDTSSELVRTKVMETVEEMKNKSEELQNNVKKH
tara:strand:- start:588 stop:1130 length:543 start_codon:yes stop_codon:yes gene_type:complete